MKNVQQEISMRRREIAELEDKIKKSSEEVERGLWADRIKVLKNEIRDIENPPKKTRVSHVTRATAIADHPRRAPRGGREITAVTI